VKRPNDAGTAVDDDRIRGWLADFIHYRESITEARIERWIRQFDDRDRDLAARVLDTVDFYGNDRIAAAFRSALGVMPGWDKRVRSRKGLWRFAAMSTTAGESGDNMLHQFRIANGLTSSKYDELFVSPSRLLQQGLGENDSIVLLDDFVGTGDQAVGAWNSAFAELVAGIGTVYLVVVAAFTSGSSRIHRDTGMKVVSGHQIECSDSFFDEACLLFADDEKESVLRYCKQALPSKPKGHGDCGLVVVFSHRCPNNAIPILHAGRNGWRPLFPRN
jgi:hypothetical protein